MNILSPDLVVYFAPPPLDRISYGTSLKVPYNLDMSHHKLSKGWFSLATESSRRRNQNVKFTRSSETGYEFRLRLRGL